MSVSDVHRVFLEMELKLKANKNGKNPRTKNNLRNIIRTKCVFIASLAITKNKSFHFSQSSPTKICSLYTAHNLHFTEKFLFCSASHLNALWHYVKFTVVFFFFSFLVSERKDVLLYKNC